MSRLDVLEAALGDEAAADLAGAFAHMVGRVAADGGPARLLLAVRACESERIGGGVLIDATVSLRFPAEKPSVHHGRAWVVDGQVTATNPQGSLWSDGPRADSAADLLAAAFSSAVASGSTS